MNPVAGRQVQVPTNTNTTEIRKMSGLEQSQILARSSGGINKIIHGNVKVSDGDTFTVGRSFTKGSMDDTRLMTDLDRLSNSFKIEADDRLCWVLIYDYGLPPGYNRDRSDILFNVEGFPYFPPGNVYGVYMETGLKYEGRRIPNYYEALERKMFDRSWAWFCTGRRKSWDPRTDDVLTFLVTLDIMLSDPMGKEPRGEQL